MNSNKTLSICIPTYNRSNHVFDLVNELLKVKTNDFEIIVQDNCSTDSTQSLLTKVNDPRFIYIRNKENIGGKLNSAMILLKASGKFSFLCLDRDFINTEYLVTLIEELKTLKDISFGYCSLDNGVSDKINIFDKGYESLYNMTFLSKHPSGNFYDTKILKDLKIFKYIPKKFKDFDFIHEFINSEASFKGQSLKLNIPIIKTGYTNNKNDFAKHKSYSYNERNFYFSPSKRAEHFFVYVDEILNLDIVMEKKRKIVNKVFFLGLLYSTFTYKNAIRDSEICNHYNIETKNITILELLKINYSFSKSFYDKELELSQIFKIKLILISNFKLILFFIKKNFKN